MNKNELGRLYNSATGNNDLPANILPGETHLRAQIRGLVETWQVNRGALSTADKCKGSRCFGNFERIFGKDLDTMKKQFCLSDKEKDKSKGSTAARITALRDRFNKERDNFDFRFTGRGKVKTQQDALTSCFKEAQFMAKEVYKNGSPDYQACQDVFQTQPAFYEACYGNLFSF